MKKKVNEGFLGNVGAKIKDTAYKAANHGYMDGKPTSIANCIKGNGWKIYKMIEKTDDHIVFSVVHDDVPMSRFIQEPGGMPFEDLVEDLNVYLEDSGKGMTASIDQEREDNAVDGYTRGRYIRIDKNQAGAPMEMNEDIQKISQLVANSAKRVLKEMYENKIINGLDPRIADEVMADKNPTPDDSDYSLEDYEAWKAENGEEDETDWEETPEVAEAVKKVAEMLVNEIKKMK